MYVVCCVQVNNTEAPDEGKGSGAEDEAVHKSSSQHYTKTKDQEFVEYLANGKKIGEEMRWAKRAPSSCTAVSCIRQSTEIYGSLHLDGLVGMPEQVERLRGYVGLEENENVYR